MLLEILVGPLWLYLIFADLPGAFTIIGGVSLVFFLAAHELVKVRPRDGRRRAAAAALLLHDALARELLRLRAGLVEDLRPQHVARHLDVC